jgi:hypothetical protein
MTFTITILVLAVIFLALYDIYALIRYGNSATISYIIYTNSKKYPIIAFAMGVIAGHFFWGQCG